MLDDFEITKLYPDKVPNNTWYSTWGNGHSRSLSSGSRDPDDPHFVLRGNSSILQIDGLGIARLSGVSPRMYVYDEDVKRWCNVEVTFYAMRVLERPEPATRGFTTGARSEHQNASNTNPCDGTAYYGRMLYGGTVDFKKELAHLPGSIGYARARPANHHADWPSTDGEIPRNLWIGYKFVVRNAPNSLTVHLSLYRDMSDGARGGSWEELIHLEDAGDWPVVSVGPCATMPTRILLEPATSVFVRNDEIDEAAYKKFSVREIEPLV